MRPLFWGCHMFLFFGPGPSGLKNKTTKNRRHTSIFFFIARRLHNLSHTVVRLAASAGRSDRGSGELSEEAGGATPTPGQGGRGAGNAAAPPGATRGLRARRAGAVATPPRDLGKLTKRIGRIRGFTIGIAEMPRPRKKGPTRKFPRG